MKMANPKKVRLIAEATVKTDEHEANRLIGLEKVGIISEA